MQNMKLKTIIFIAKFSLILLPAMAFASALENGRCYLMDFESGPCLLKINGAKFEISINGMVHYLPSGAGTKKIHIVLPEHYYVEAVQGYSFANCIILNLEISDGDAGSTLVAMLNKPNITLNWTFELGAFNPSPPLVTDDSIYIGGIGTIAKLNLKTGHTVWKHTGLYEKDTGAFNSFIKPIKQGEIIIFKDNSVSKSNQGNIREIRVIEKSGEIIQK